MDYPDQSFGTCNVALGIARSPCRHYSEGPPAIVSWPLPGTLVGDACGSRQAAPSWTRGSAADLMASRVNGTEGDEQLRARLATAYARLTLLCRCCPLPSLRTAGIPIARPVCTLLIMRQRTTTSAHTYRFGLTKT